MRALRETNFGIICITPENIASPWLLFEAGAVSKALQGSFVCPYLIDLEPDFLKGPWTQFQAVKADEIGTWKMVQAINETLKESALNQSQLKVSFKNTWGELNQVLKDIPPQDDFDTRLQESFDELESIRKLLIDVVQEMKDWRRQASDRDYET